MASRHQDVELLSAWVEKLAPVNVDLVGDFAGKELIVIHGESLMAYCIAQAKVDYQEGFQLVHAVHAVEDVLVKLVDRGCNLQIAWFDSHEKLCAPPQTHKEALYKYTVSREILIEHLRQAGHPRQAGHLRLAGMSHRFPSPDSKQFEEYVADNAVQCVLCTGPLVPATSRDNVRLELQAFMYRISSMGCSVAMLSELKFVSSKVTAPVFTSTGQLAPLKIGTSNARSYASVQQQQCLPEIRDGLSAREYVSIAALNTLLSQDDLITSRKDGRQEMRFCATAFLVHLVLLQHYTLEDRDRIALCSPPDGDGEDNVGGGGLGNNSDEDESEESLDDFFFHHFSEQVFGLMRRWSDEPQIDRLKWDVYDLVDGRLFQEAKAGLAACKLEPRLTAAVGRLVEQVPDLNGIDLAEYAQPRLAHWYDVYSASSTGLAPATEETGASRSHHHKSPRNPSVLPFSHPTIDAFLQEIHLRTEEDEGPVSESQSRIFQELTHWHNAKKTLDPKLAVKQRPSTITLKRNQRFMAETLKYSASLTGAQGKIINPETIVVQTPASEHKLAAKLQATARAGQGESKNNSKKGHQNLKAGNKNGQPKNSLASSKKGKALEAAQAIQQEKLQAKSKAVIAHWQVYCDLLGRETDDVKRYSMAVQFMRDRSSADLDIITPDATVYCAGVLMSYWSKMSKNKGQSLSLGNDVLAMIWLRVMGAIRMAPRLSEASREEVVRLARAVSLPESVILQPGLLISLAGHNQGKGMSETTALGSMGAVEFQLQHCGPYLERSFDSAPDARVSFEPDAWQRQVLDAIDEDKSILVVAPTSAGKTFISFYAMKKILQANDDDVLVYVAPTKALVNQIAAEIQARFSKQYRRDGRSVWAIHTRDYRTNNPTGCQVLVTVPHILQIMLLAPVNAKKEDSWSRRVRCIIFDEVHCIGQAEDGVIWEQLILLAPCPIIALSATVGNPHEFASWLAASQAKRGRKVEMISHPSRYSDLRKYLYQPPSSFTFSGLVKKDRLPVPGLEGDEEPGSSHFRFIHPAAALVNRNRDTLDDISFEPRDCLALWRIMEKRSKYKLENDSRELAPAEFLPKVLKKSDVLPWELALKSEFQHWMRTQGSPFLNVLAELRGKLPGDEPQSPVKRSKMGGGDGGDGDFSVEITPQSGSDEGWAAAAPRTGALALLVDLHAQGALPAILFNFDRMACELTLRTVLSQIVDAEAEWKRKSPEWTKTEASYAKWKKSNVQSGKQAKTSAGKEGRDKDNAGERTSKLDLAREEGTRERSKWEGFNPEAPVDRFSFADRTKLTSEELEEAIRGLKWARLPPYLIDGLRRGLAVHHAGMNRRYRQLVETFFRKGFLTAVVATGTLALGINMPCKTVVMMGDSAFLTPLNYHQASGRAGRRGFDLLGNVVFHGVPTQRVFEIMSAKLPDLRGQFPLTPSLILRLLTLSHHTENADYSRKALEGLLSQTRVYLGGPESEMAIKHHVRFSIDYLRRRHLLSATGAPLNFAGMVSHLYYTENAAFAFHALLERGYFHELCADIDRDPAGTTTTLMLVLSHLFGRIPCPWYQRADMVENHVHRSSSIVFLPQLPPKAAAILREHNKSTLDIFHNYVLTYIRQHLHDTPDNVLPLTGCTISPDDPWPLSLASGQVPPPAPTTRSAFAALSGLADSFETIDELCSTVRDGVFLEQTAVPSIPVYPEETGGVPFNAYLYDFFRHGELQTLTTANGIKRGDVWFKLKDFSLVIATIVASLTNIVDPDADPADALLMDEDSGEGPEDREEPPDAEDESPAAVEPAKEADADAIPAPHYGKRKGPVVESWEDGSESDDDQEASGCEESVPAWDGLSGDQQLTKVLKAFATLRAEFDTKFLKIFA